MEQSKFKIHYERFDKLKKVTFGELGDPRRMQIYIFEYYIKEYEDTFDIYFVFDTVPKGHEPCYIKAVGFRNLKQYNVIETVMENIKNEFGVISLYHCDMKNKDTFMVHNWSEFEEDFFHDSQHELHS